MRAPRAPHLLLTLCFALGAAVPLKKLPEVDCSAVDEIVLEVTQATVSIEDHVLFTTRAYSYLGKPLVPGPVIKMTANSSCVIRVVNNLSPAGNEACNSTLTSGVVNGFVCPDVTNLHAYGAMIDVYVSVGACEA